MWYQCKDKCIRVNLYIQPGVKRTEISGLHGDSLKIRLQVPPIDGRANAALLKFMAQLFAVPVSQVALQRGDKSRHKTIMITGSCIDPASLITAH